MFSLLRTSKSLAYFGKRSFGLTRPTKNLDNPKANDHFIAMEYDFGCHNYHPIPVVAERAQGIHVWDVEGKQYLDFLSAYSAVNQGHGHPKILKTLIDQAQKLHLTSRAFHSNQLGPTEKYLADLFGYEKALLMNTGVEAGESAIKLARRWAYNIKKVPDNQAVTLFASNNFWGRTIAACGSSDDPDRYRKFGPFGGLGFEIIPYNDVQALEAKFKENPNIAAFMVEPIQGEAGVIFPEEGYLKKVRELCTKYKVLLICDEVQTGLGRTGKLYACQWENVKPDMLLLGKATTGGVYPVSVVLTNKEIMDQIKPGEHGSTYGGNPLGSAVTRTAIQVLIDEGMIENSLKLGKVLYDGLKSLKNKSIKEVRGGKGLFAAVEFHEHSNVSASDVSYKLVGNGLLAKPTHGTTIRFSPPLIITEAQLNQGLDIIKKSFADFN
jgi:ornithine--oxo-acid transaminase